MAILFVKRMKMTLLAGLMLVSVASYGQEYMDALHRLEAVTLDVRRVEAEIEVLEREVAVYDKDIRKNEHLQEKMKDKEHRLKYKVMSELSKMDTTVPHKMTYKEWQLEKAERERAHATAQLAKAQQNRESRILALADKTKELQDARTRLYNAGMTNPGPARHKKVKQKTKQPKDHKGKEAELRG